jgi:hypothetical protein
VSKYKRAALLADSNFIVRRCCVDTLRSLRYEVVMCGSQAEGVRCAERNMFEPAIVTQGSHTFYGCSELVKAWSPNMKCYLDAMQLGAVEYLEGPVTPGIPAWIVETPLRPGPGGAVIGEEGVQLENGSA